MRRSTERPTRLGRPEELRNEDLSERYKAVKRFLEDNWGRLGLKLKKARHPERVLAALKLVPGVEWCKPFREHASCLLVEANQPVNGRELRSTRQKYDQVVVSADRLWSEYLQAIQLEQPAIVALKAGMSQCEGAIGFFPYFFVVFLLAKELGVEELHSNTTRLMASALQARAAKEALAEERSRQEAWFARNEIVEFVRSKRYDVNPVNLAKAMAGMPEYGWLHSFR